MVVLDHYVRRLTGAVQLIDDGAGKGAVGGQIPRLPGPANLLLDVGALQAAPQGMLQEPEDRIAENAIVEVVGVPRERHEAMTALSRPQLDVRTGAVPQSHLPIALCHRAGYPGKVGQGGEAAQGRQQPPTTMPDLPSAVPATVILDGAAVA